MGGRRRITQSFAKPQVVTLDDIRLLHDIRLLRWVPPTKARSSRRVRIGSRAYRPLPQLPLPDGRMRPAHFSYPSLIVGDPLAGLFDKTLTTIHERRGGETTFRQQRLAWVVLVADGS